VTYFSALERVLHAPDVRWTKGPDGKNYGIFIDAMLDERVRDLISWAEDCQSVKLLGMAGAIFERLAPELGYSAWRLGSCVRILQTLDSSPWVIQNQGREFRRAILDAVLTNLSSARHSQWKAVLDYRKACLFWQSADDHLLFDELKEYRRRVVSDEYDNSESLSDLQDLRDGLRTLQKSHRIYFRRTITRLNAKIAEREGEPEDDDYQYTPPTRSAAKQDVLNEPEIRDLFSTLVD
jgi:hypothetical protein